MKINEKILYAFLDDANQHELRLNHDRVNCLLIKSAFDAETDFLYLLEGYGKDPHAIAENAIYAGVYSHVRRQYFDIPYKFQDDLNMSDSIENLLAEFSCRVSARITKKVQDASVPVTEETDEIRDEREYFLKYTLPGEALAYFLGGTEPPRWGLKYCASSFSTAQIALILNHFEDAVEAQSEVFICKNARDINERRWRIEMVRETAAQLENTPGEHHTRRAIMRSVADVRAKTFNLEIQKGGGTVSVKIEKEALMRKNDSYYSPWSMDASSRRKLKECFGPGADVRPNDVMKITYGKKVLYAREGACVK